MTFSKATKICFSKYATSTGRASRSEYWWFYLFIILGTIFFGVIDAIVFGFDDSDPSPISSVFSLATFIPTIAVTIRRLHDVDRSGWWQVAPISFILLTGIMAAIEAIILAIAAGVAAFICIILLIVWLIKRGTIGDNRFGSDPLSGPENGDEDNYSPSSIPEVK